MDALLRFTFRLTGSRRVSDLISERRCEQRWRKHVAAHIRSGGFRVTVQDAGGTQEYLA